MELQIKKSKPVISGNVTPLYFNGLIIAALLALLPLFGESFRGGLTAQNVSINPTGAPGNASSMVDVNASNKGMLIPRVALTSITDITTISTPATSLLVFNTATAGTFPNNVVPGFYYWDGMKWISLLAPTGAGSSLAFADFYALMPPNNPVPVGPGAAVEFPNAGPTSGTAITALSANQFKLAAIGTYMVNWQVSIDEPGQLVLALDSGGGPIELLSTVVGRSTGTSQIVGSRLITTNVVNSLLTVRNPAAGLFAITITPNAGNFFQAVSASLVITRLQ